MAADTVRTKIQVRLALADRTPRVGVPTEACVSLLLEIQGASLAGFENLFTNDVGVAAVLS
jgi:hypothetical protein